MSELEDLISSVEETTRKSVIVTRHADKYMALLVDLEEVGPTLAPAPDTDQDVPESTLESTASTLPKDFSLRAVAELEIVEEEMPLDAQDEAFFKEEFGARIAGTAETAVADLYLTWRSTNTRLEGSVDERYAAEIYRQRDRAA